jgi:hypothetical protein
MVSCGSSIGVDLIISRKVAKNLNVGTLSDNVGLTVRILSINVGSRDPMLSVPRDYIINPLHVPVLPVFRIGMI